MPTWHDEEAWRKYCSGEDCRICDHRGPRGWSNVIVETPNCWVSSQPRGTTRGYCCIWHKRHVVELQDLTPAEAAAFIHDWQCVSRGIQQFTGAIKMNHETHGNSVPHLHVHIFPRYKGDPYENRPIDGREDREWFSAEEFARFAAAVRAAVEAQAGRQ